MYTCRQLLRVAAASLLLAEETTAITSLSFDASIPRATIIFQSRALYIF